MPLVNSAQPPTVRDDLLEIQRANQIDDSTLDDIADLLAHHDRLSPVLNSRGVKLEPIDGGNGDNNDNRNVELDRKDLKVLDRMGRSLETGLLSIQAAKEGIQSLESQVAQLDTKDHPQHTSHDSDTKGESLSCPACRGSRPLPDAGLTYIHLPLPRLWSRPESGFRFTPLGLGLFLLSLWYIAESWMCFRYCKPEYCYPGVPCDWSADDPVWGYTIPTKLDQWTTGGQGGRLARRIRPEVADWLADMFDAAMGTDITAVDTSRFSWEQKRQHRRRLAKKGLRMPVVTCQDTLREWKSVREASEKAQAARDMGYEVDEDEMIGGDEKL